MRENRTPPPPSPFAKISAGLSGNWQSYRHQLALPSENQDSFPIRSAESPGDQPLSLSAQARNKPTRRPQPIKTQLPQRPMDQLRLRHKAASPISTNILTLRLVPVTIGSALRTTIRAYAAGPWERRLADTRTPAIVFTFSSWRSALLAQESLHSLLTAGSPA